MAKIILTEQPEITYETTENYVFINQEDPQYNGRIIIAHENLDTFKKMIAGIPSYLMEDEDA